MKYLKIVIEPFKIKGEEDDEEQLNQDVLEMVAAMVESETLSFHVEEDESEEDD